MMGARQETLLVQIQNPEGLWLDVGFVRKDDPKNWFEFTDSYWGLPGRPVLGQIFEEQGRHFKPTAHVALPHWFSHLLPEGRLRSAVADAAHTSPAREFELLKRLGRYDLPGALRVQPVTSPFDLAPPDLADEDALADEHDPILKFSLAGAQLKFSVFSDERGITIPARGQAGNVIIKFPDGRTGFGGVPEAELGSLELARASGFAVAEAELRDPSEVEGLERWASGATGMALAVHRFDRKGADGRVHMEELAQVMNIPTKPDVMKYKRGNLETVASYVGALAGPEAVGEVIDRIVLNVIIGNGDAHLKNWAFLYPDGRTPELSPLYDVLPTVLYVANDDMGLHLNQNKKFEEVTPASFERLAMRAGYGVEAARMRASDAVDRIMENWTLMKEYLPAEEFKTLTNRHRSLAIMRH